MWPKSSALHPAHGKHWLHTQYAKALRISCEDQQGGYSLEEGLALSWEFPQSSVELPSGLCAQEGSAADSRCQTT